MMKTSALEFARRRAGYAAAVPALCAATVLLAGCGGGGGGGSTPGPVTSPTPSPSPSPVATPTPTPTPTPAQVVVTVAPAAATVSVGDTTAFTAEVRGVAEQGVVWSVRESGGGAISEDGVYTAPALPGTYHVVATRRADAASPGATATATVTVQAGDAAGVIQ